MKVFLDDVRHPQDCVGYMYQRIGTLNPIYLQDWKVVRNYEEFVEVVEKDYEVITHISFDHDLADEHYFDCDRGFCREDYEERTGLDCANWVKTFYKEKAKKLPTLFVHSMNPVGTQNIINVFKTKTHA